MWKIFFNFPFKSVFFFFFFFFCLTALGRISSAILSNSSEIEHPCLACYFRETAFRLFPRCYSFFPVVVLCHMNKFPSVPKLSFFLKITNECWLLLNAYSLSSNKIIQFFFFNLLMHVHPVTCGFCIHKVHKWVMMISSENMLN